MAEAYDHARGVGVPARDLRADQLDWREIRDSAAQLSRDDLLRAYADRIQEVWDLADSWMEATGGPGSGLGRRNGRP
ncbi:MAG TPA: hypothetical protein VL460_05240 [Caulobacteraceae bacterium]|nr:hypothetical protein [Caulobacteraceae bacterium]